jgi:hypothetical protein
MRVNNSAGKCTSGVDKSGSVIDKFGSVNYRMNMSCKKRGKEQQAKRKSAHIQTQSLGARTQQKAREARSELDWIKAIEPLR